MATITDFVSGHSFAQQAARKEIAKAHARQVGATRGVLDPIWARMNGRRSDGATLAAALKRRTAQ
jgi:hypothetical protein